MSRDGYLDWRGDDGDLPELLQPLSCELAFFLRRQAPKLALCEDGWMPAQEALERVRDAAASRSQGGARPLPRKVMAAASSAGFGQGSPSSAASDLIQRSTLQDLQEVVARSRKGMEHRFESRMVGGLLFIRAVRRNEGRQHRRPASNPNGWPGGRPDSNSQESAWPTSNWASSDDCRRSASHEAQQPGTPSTSADPWPPWPTSTRPAGQAEGMPSTSADPWPSWPTKTRPAGQAEGSHGTPSTSSVAARPKEPPEVASFASQPSNARATPAGAAKSAGSSHIAPGGAVQPKAPPAGFSTSSWQQSSTSWTSPASDAKQEGWKDLPDTMPDPWAGKRLPGATQNARADCPSGSMQGPSGQPVTYGPSCTGPSRVAPADSARPKASPHAASTSGASSWSPSGGSAQQSGSSHSASADSARPKSVPQAASTCGSLPGANSDRAVPTAQTSTSRQSLEGEWVSARSDLKPFARIDGQNLISWCENQSRTYLKEIADGKFLLEDDDTKLTYVATLSGTDVISWSDGDEWRRFESTCETTQPQNTADVQEAAENTSSAHHAGSETPLAPFQPGLGTPKECRARGSFDGTSYGPEFLSITKGELLLVQPIAAEGWKFGQSVQSKASGWLPPDYLKDEM